jgi:hypothetical protein
MKNQVVKITLLALMAGFSGVSMAHNTGAQTLGAAATARDIFRTTCFAWNNGIFPDQSVGAPGAGEANGSATKFFTQVNVTVGTAANIRIQALPGGAVSSTTSTSNTGDGVHYFIVSHTVAGAHTYNADLHCQNAASQHTGTGDTFTGNPPSVTPTVDFVRTLNQ